MLEIKNFRMRTFRKSCRFCDYYVFVGEDEWRCAIGVPQSVPVSKCNPWMTICDTYTKEV